MENEINNKREEMHKIMNSKDCKYEDILKISKELDILILEYYKTKGKNPNIKIAK